MEYLWDAVWCFFEEGDPAAERWVQEKSRASSKHGPLPDSELQKPSEVLKLP